MSTKPWLVTFLLLFGFANLSSATATEIKSPNGRLKIFFKLGGYGFEPGQPHYRIVFNGQEVVGESKLGLEFLNQGALNSDLTLKEKHTEVTDETYVMPTGKTLNVRNHFSETKFRLEEKKAPHRQLDVSFRAYNDGVAFRYGIPKQAAISQFVITEELTEVSLPAQPTMYALPLNFASAYEAYYKSGPLSSFVQGQTLGLPLLLKYQSGVMVGLTEAGLTDYAGQYVMPSSEKDDVLVTRLAPMPKDQQVKVRGVTPFDSPWRVFIVGDSPKTLLESNLVLNLNPPSMIKDTSWIHPGKIQFPWWNGYILPVPDAAHKGGLNTWMIKRYIDFCAANGIPYHSIDGFDQAWYGGPVDPYGGSDITKAIPELNLPEILQYARDRKVGTRIWIHGTALASNLDHALDVYKSWGIEGIMVDFLNRDDQEMVQYYTDIIKKTAAHHMTVNFHGVFKPTGVSRTYPNLLNHEAVLGTEYNKWSETGSTPEHELLITYIRMLAGPLDTHQGSFRPVPQRNYKMSYLAPRAIGTLARQLALYVVYENHLPMLADFPEAYDVHRDALKFVREVPVVWDDTLMVAGQFESSIVLARRKDDDWYLGRSITVLNKMFRCRSSF